MFIDVDDVALVFVLTDSCFGENVTFLFLIVF
jgi:hypothetical protein